jgi:hypothetical protein
MTWALCFHCGATKFGAICPCPECQVGSTGNMNLDISFSDHRMSKDSLADFGRVIRSIREVCPDDAERFWAFIHYVSTRHPDILHVELSAEKSQQLESTLARAQPPDVTVTEPEWARTMPRDASSANDS